MTPSQVERSYPRTLQAGDRTVELVRLAKEHRKALLRFAKGLKEKDKLFLRVDITDPDVVDDWIADQEDDRRITLLALDGDKVIGYGSLNRQNLRWMRHLGEIRLIVSSKIRGGGLGGSLAAEIFEIAKEVGLQKIVARMAREQLGAQNLFRRLGFVAEAILTDHVMDAEGKTHDLVMMSHDVTGLGV